MKNRQTRFKLHGRQHGLSLLFALMALVVLTLAAVALVRSVDTGSLVIGNLGFKQDATSAAGQAAEQALTWLNTNAGQTLRGDVAAAGYYASSRDSLDVTGHMSTASNRAVVDWTGDGCSLYPAGSFGTCVAASPEIVLNGGNNRARYVITRLCAVEGNPAAIDCAFPLGAAMTSGGNKGSVDYKQGKAVIAVNNLQYYRIVVRAQGPRGTVAFTETIVQM
ncbi:hypothetical protein [Paucibacter sp. KBW04]|uniref:pilus assembly PilX family protein n=1 Tax=Paucibacter sp. KBW04 TaxID=2153361 RepID=UPI000F57E914|nr:hypothetical protein [Paucibacter sp. KBW04]